MFDVFVTLLMELEAGNLVAYAGLLCMALIPIYVGSYRSLDQKKNETMSSNDAWMFPVVGSCVLFGLYMLFKWFNKDYVNMLLTCYFLLFGLLAVAASMEPILASLMHPKKIGTEVSLNLPLLGKVEFTYTPAWAVSMVLSAAVSVWYLLTKHWIANNILGIAFSVQGVAMISLGSYNVGCILLGCLFFYDIFWVFGTDVMVTVAKSFEAPIKVLFPRDVFADEWEFSLLGLGDIVIPGIFIALLLRFDAQQARREKGQYSFPNPYFKMTFVAYVLALATTMFVMHYFQAAQPALLYLVPYCIGASLLCALLRGELSQLRKYTEETEPETGSDEGGTLGKDKAE